MTTTTAKRRYWYAALGALVLAGAVGTGTVLNHLGTAHADSGQTIQQPVADGGTSALPAPVNGWFAGKLVPSPYIPGFNPTDPINVVLTDSTGHASDDLVSALKSAQWSDNTCYDAGVMFATSGTAAAPSYSKPVAVLDTDPSTTSGGIHLVTGCGTKGNTRDHVRIWQNDGNTIAWGAASLEYVTDALKPHQLQDGAFDSGRDKLAADLKNGLTGTGKTYGFTAPSANYTCAAVDNDIKSCTGSVALFTVQGTTAQTGTDQAGQQAQPCTPSDQQGMSGQGMSDQGTGQGTAAGQPCVPNSGQS